MPPSSRRGSRRISDGAKATGLLMPKPSLDWNLMYNALLDYKKRFGNCNVPANWRENRQLGRWVSVLRFRHKVEGLPPAQVDKLKAAGFI